MTCEKCDVLDGETIEVGILNDTIFCRHCGGNITRKNWNKSEKNMLEIHARALCAHCECLALNAANMYSVIHDDHPPYHQGHYQEILEKWNLINEKGEPTF